MKCGIDKIFTYNEKSVFEVIMYTYNSLIMTTASCTTADHCNHYWGKWPRATIIESADRETAGKVAGSKGKKSL